jgi:hypothetical protein
MSLIANVASNLLRSPGPTAPSVDSAAVTELRRLYLDMVQRTVINTIYEDPAQTFGNTYQAEVREIGSDWPSLAHSMIGNRRMGNLREICETVLAQNVPGDFIETGVWRGGACILMRAVLKAWNVSDRKVWVADSFEGLPGRTRTNTRQTAATTPSSTANWRYPSNRCNPILPSTTCSTGRCVL